MKIKLLLHYMINIFGNLSYFREIFSSRVEVDIMK